MAIIKELETLLRVLSKEYPYSLKEDELFGTVILKNETKAWMNKTLELNTKWGVGINDDKAKQLVNLAVTQKLVSRSTNPKQYTITENGLNLLNQAIMERWAKFSGASIIILTTTLVLITLLQPYLKTFSNRTAIFLVFYVLAYVFVFIWLILKPRRRNRHLISPETKK